MFGSSQYFDMNMKQKYTQFYMAHIPASEKTREDLKIFITLLLCLKNLLSRAEKKKEVQTAI
jgi:hypothetical protein